MDDKQILEIYSSGQTRQAFNLIIRKYGERLYLHIRHMTASHEDADDCMQNTLIKAWEALPGFRGDAGIYTWLYRIATNETINFLRKHKWRELLSPIDIATRLENDPSFNGDKLQAALQRAIAKLPPKQKAVFIMRYYDDMPYEQMAKITGTSESALKASYHFAYNKVKDWVLNFFE